MGFVLRTGAVLLGLISLGLIGGGGRLLALGGSAYYLIAGAAYLIGAAMLWKGRGSGGWIVAAVALLTIPWALWESGLDYWALFPRLLVPFAIAAIVLFFVPWARDPVQKRPAWSGSAVFGIAFIVLFGEGFVDHGVIEPAASAAYTLAGGDNQPSNWTAYGRSPRGDRFSPFNQINRGNVNALQVAWTYRTGDKGPGIDQNTPLQIDDLVYSCTRNDKVIALDADTGEARWINDPKAQSPFWQRCRGLGYYKVPEAAGEACKERIVQTTIDARLLELDAKTGEPCRDFGQAGVVSLSDGMGSVSPGFYFQTSAPLVARDYIVVGGWVVDNQMRGEPSGVIRAFDARNGSLVWAWDLGNPAITRDPPPGETYTRGTPNSWSTAAYDDRLGLIYLPLGNATPDYYGIDRPAHSDEYNSSLVALDVMTGRERWHFRTVNNDIWDYDLPSQPALIDVPDGKGGVTEAVLQTTKRGQIFLLDRATGQPIADVEQRPVTQKGAVPEQKLAATQPYSVGMPTIGAELLTEQKAWGATMLDQLYCRIAFRKLRYDGDFTPIGLTPAIQQPGNTGGFNWGSVSVDAANGLVYMNDIRIPSTYYLVKRDEYPAVAKRLKADQTGHGPSPQIGTPFGMVTEVWMSPLGIPCTQPPFGTITAIDLTSRKVAWQRPAGTAEQTGPMGIATGLPLTMGMPTYAGTIATAGGLVFFFRLSGFLLTRLRRANRPGNLEIRAADRLERDTYDLCFAQNRPTICRRVGGWRTLFKTGRRLRNGVCSSPQAIAGDQGISRMRSRPAPPAPDRAEIPRRPRSRGRRISGRCYTKSSD